jgi:hypothetical protein
MCASVSSSRRRARPDPIPARSRVHPNNRTLLRLQAEASIRCERQDRNRTVTPRDGCPVPSGLPFLIAHFPGCRSVTDAVGENGTGWKYSRAAAKFGPVSGEPSRLDWISDRRIVYLGDTDRTAEPNSFNYRRAPCMGPCWLADPGAVLHCESVLGGVYRFQKNVARHSPMAGYTFHLAGCTLD